MCRLEGRKEREGAVIRRLSGFRGRGGGGNKVASYEIHIRAGWALTNAHKKRVKGGLIRDHNLSGGKRRDHGSREKRRGEAEVELQKREGDLAFARTQNRKEGK